MAIGRLAAAALVILCACGTAAGVSTTHVDAAAPTENDGGPQDAATSADGSVTVDAADARSGPINCSTIDYNPPELTYEVAYCMGSMCGDMHDQADCESTAQFVFGDGSSVCVWKQAAETGADAGATCVYRGAGK